MLVHKINRLISIYFATVPSYLALNNNNNNNNDNILFLGNFTTERNYKHIILITNTVANHNDISNNNNNINVYVFDLLQFLLQ